MPTKSQDRRKVRLSRALGIPLTPKAAKYLEKRPYAPGEHGRTKRKQDSDYAVRLREKQRLREQYGIREKQMRNTFNEARRKDGLTGENLVELLEMRLDALVLPTTTSHPTLAEVAADPVGANSRMGRFTNFVNLLDLSALAVPAGRVDGLPFGVQLVGDTFQDDRLVDVAREGGFDGR